MTSLVLVDGGGWREQERAVAGEGVFETVGLQGNGLPLWSHHMRRLREGARRLDQPCRVPRTLERVVLARLRAQGDDVARVCWLRTAHGMRWVIDTRARDRDHEPLPVVLAPSPRPISTRDDCKLWPRPQLDAARADARAAGAHDAILWRGEHVLEATAYSLLVAVDGRLHTPPADGSILPGVARALLLRAGLPIDEAPVRIADLRKSPLIVLTNAVHGPRWAQFGSPPHAAAPASSQQEALLAQVRAEWRTAANRR